METDEGLRRDARQVRTIGARLLLAGGILFAIGLLLMLAGDGIADVLGVLFAAIATPPTVGGLALLISGFFARGAAEHRPLG